MTTAHNTFGMFVRRMARNNSPAYADFRVLATFDASKPAKYERLIRERFANDAEACSHFVDVLHSAVAVWVQVARPTLDIDTRDWMELGWGCYMRRTHYDAAADTTPEET